MPCQLVLGSRVIQHGNQVENEGVKPIMESRTLKQSYPWRGRVVHVRSHRATKVKFDDSLNESISTYDDYGDHCDDGIKYDVTSEHANREHKSILKKRDLPVCPTPEQLRLNGARKTNVNSPNIEDIAEVLKFLKKVNRVPRLAFSQRFRHAEQSWKGLEKKLDNIIPYLLDGGFIEEKIYDDLRNLQISRTLENQRVKLTPYRDEYEPCRGEGCPLTGDDIAKVPKGTLLRGIARKVFSDNTVLMANPSEPERIVQGGHYRVIINGKLEPIQCRKRLQGDCWQVLVLRSASFDVVTEERIKRHMNDLSSVRLHFLGRPPIPNESFVAQVEGVKAGLLFVTLQEESFLSHLSISSSKSVPPCHVQARAIAYRGELLLARADLEPLVTSFGLSLAACVKEYPAILFTLYETQQFVLSTYKLRGFDNTDYITACDLACLLDKSENRDDTLIKELLLI